METSNFGKNKSVKCGMISLTILKNLEMHLVMPSPPNMETDIAGHIVIIQAPHDTWISNLVTVFDNFISRREQHMMRLVITTDEQIWHSNVARACGYGLPDGSLDPAITLHVSIDRHILDPTRPWPGRPGHELTVQVIRQITTLPSAGVNADEHSFLHIDVQRSDREGPEILSLETLLFEDQPHLVPVSFKHLDYTPNLPSELVVLDGCSTNDIEIELAKQGHQRHVYDIQCPATVPNGTFGSQMSRTLIMFIVQRNTLR